MLTDTSCLATGNLLPTPPPASNSHTLVALPSSIMSRVTPTAASASESDDELSEAAESPVALTERPSTSNIIPTAAETCTSDASNLHDDDADGSDDADVDFPPQPRPARPYVQSSSSSVNAHGQSRSGGTPEDEEFMRKNPELYGLRRSVSLASLEKGPRCLQSNRAEHVRRGA